MLPEEGPFLSFVIPSLGVEEALEDTITEVITATESAGLVPFEIVVPYTPKKEDDEKVHLDALKKTFGKNLRIIREPRKGYGVAYFTGFSHSKGDIIVTLDADLTYPLDILSYATKFFKERDLDFINTNRLDTHQEGAFTWSHDFGNRFLTLLMNTMYNTGFIDSQSGMWFIRRSKLEKMDLQGVHWEFSVEIKIEARRQGLRCAEIPILYRRREEGDTTNSWREGIKIAAYIIMKKLGLTDLHWNLFRKKFAHPESMMTMKGN